MEFSPRHDTLLVNGIRMHYVEQGKGPAVVLLHGFPENWYAWRHQIPALCGAVPSYRSRSKRLRRISEAGERIRQENDGKRHTRTHGLSRNRESRNHRP